MAGLKYLKELTNSLCLRDMGMRWNNEALTLILSSGLVDLCYLIITLDKKIDFFKGSCLNSLSDKVGHPLEDSLREVIGLKDHNVLLKSLDNAFNGHEEEFCFLVNDSTFHCISKPLLDNHNEEISGAMIVAFKKDWG